MKSIKLTPIHIAFGGVLVIVALVAGGFWFAGDGERNSMYVEAAADCRNGIGAGKLLALDDLYGSKARPKDLYWELSQCAHDYRMERIRYLQGLRDSLSN
ncbi:hypothetical protein [uncultured Roseovarius sp.]|uniref:hypothetical protein n=1 Tax=uncultured Roseovarius sp. TaxID=293344 RepID=UPI00260A78EB|nr:hypothetical protein [uncultured Roseovarius sp.]